MLIYTVGCSHTEGTQHALNGDFSKAYPNVLASHYDAELVDDSKSMHSNDYIFRKTMEFVTSCPVPPDLVVVQWTHHERMELCKSNNTSTYMETFAPSNWLSDHKKEPIDRFHRFVSSLSDRVNLTDEGKLKRNFYPIQTKGYGKRSHKVLNYTYSLQCVFEEMGIDNYKFIMWNSVDHRYNTYKHLDKTKCIFNAEYLLDQEFTRANFIDKETGFVDLHFKADAHQQIAEWIITDYHNEEVSAPDDMSIYDYTNLTSGE